MKREDGKVLIFVGVVEEKRIFDSISMIIISLCRNEEMISRREKQRNSFHN